MELPRSAKHTLEIDKVEQQQAYHAKLFKLNRLLNPDLITERPFNIIGHNQIQSANKVVTNMKTKYTTPSMLCSPDDNIKIVDLEDLRVDHLWQCIAYASKQKLLYRIKTLL